MSAADGSIDLVFGGDERHFRLGIDNLIALQDKLASGPLEIVTRFQLRVWRVQDVTETLRVGLIGGGMDAKAAQALVDANVRAGNVLPHVLTAQAVLMNALQGDPDDPVGKKMRRRTRRKANASPPPRTTETAR